jgi:hypothetical protein
MKNLLRKTLVVLAILGTTAQMQAYKYSFTNHTNNEISIAMRYKGIGEPRYRIHIPAHESRQFRPGDGQIPRIKIGFLPQAFWYINKPTAAHKANHKTAPWREFAITWVPTDKYQLAIDLAEAIGQTTEGAGKLALEAGGAYASGGASLAAEEAAKAASAAKRAATGETLTSAGGNVGGLGLANLLKAVGKSGAHSMMRDRHIDIVEDETGKLSFISLLT